MRHHKIGRKLNRTSSHREAMFKNMAASLFLHEQIRTTLPKAKELRRVAEPLITMAKNATVANRRLAFARLRDRVAVTKLFDILGVRYKDRPGGYLRILKFGLYVRWISRGRIWAVHQLHQGHGRGVAGTETKF